VLEKGTKIQETGTGYLELSGDLWGSLVISGDIWSWDIWRYMRIFGNIWGYLVISIYGHT
jgi:hypothetical protein